MMTMEYPKVLVLRLPEEQGNFTYWMAELPDEEARRWKEKLSRGETDCQPSEFDHTFGDPLTLTEVMERLESRDFQVLDCPAHH